MNGAADGADWLDRTLRVVYRVEDGILASLLGAMIILAPLQIFLRVFFDEALAWADPVIRVLVLWVGLFGAISASRGDRHINIDVLTRVLRGRARAAAGLLIHAFTTVVCGVVAWHAWRFVESEREFESMAFLDVPAWLLELVLPFAFGVIAIRYGLMALHEGGILLGVRQRVIESVPSGDGA